MPHASLWHGTAASWVDLSLDLTGSWRDTFARSIWSDGTTLFIVGEGINVAANRTEALLWTRPVPEPCPKCAAPFVTERIARGGKITRQCIREECGYKQEVTPTVA